MCVWGGGGCWWCLFCFVLDVSRFFLCFVCFCLLFLTVAIAVSFLLFLFYAFALSCVRRFIVDILLYCRV